MSSNQSTDTEAVNELSLPTHWKQLLQGKRSQSNDESPQFFRFLMSTPSTAKEIASSETAMQGVFNYDQ